MKTKPMPRPEYPRTQFRREGSWMNLNGVWDFFLDLGNTGLDRKLEKDPSGYDSKIVVPFCPESKLSGIGYKDFFESAFYHREVTFPKGWAGKRILLNFGAVDYECTAWIDGREVGHHIGGSSAFSFDVTLAAKPGEEQDLFVHAVDRLRSREQGGGKQCYYGYYSSGCYYTRTTGIWQTVWAEAVHEDGLAACPVTPNYDTGDVVFSPRFIHSTPGDLLRIQIREGRKVVAERTAPASPYPLVISLGKFREWNPDDPFLYDATVTVERGGDVIDKVETYFAMRKFTCEDGRFFLNNKPIFLRLVLDQGFYPTGIWTAPSDAELKKDVQRSMAMGFNGARLHQKVFEDRFHYWADKLGYITWAEYPSWGLDVVNKAAHRNFLADWGAVVDALRSHPSIVAWTPMNETAYTGLDGRNYADTRVYREFTRRICAMTRAIDPTRPVNDASGHLHADTDIWTVHSYRATPKEQREFLCPKKQDLWFLPPDIPVRSEFPSEAGYRGQPYVIDEWGGFKYLRPEDRKGDTGWGYNGLKFEDPAAFIAQIKPQVDLFISLKNLAGHCYTQLTDVEQEQNGLYTYARKPKVDPKLVHAAMSAKPKWSRW